MRWARTSAVASLICAACLTARTQDFSPTALAVSDGKLYVASAATNQIVAVDLSSGKVVQEIRAPGHCSGLVVAPGKLYVTCAGPVSTVVVVELSTGEALTTVPAGHTAMAPVLHPNGKTLYVCNRFDNNVSVIDLQSLHEIERIPTSREPVAAAITPDGKHLFIANHLHNGRADAEHVSATVSVIDTDARKVLREISLPNGSGLLRGVSVSPDGKHAAVVHLLSRFNVPTTQIERGWINNNALTIIDVGRLEVINTVLLDEIDRGAANPWDCGWSADGKFIVVTHAGTHEVSLIDAPRLLKKLLGMPLSAEAVRGAPTDYTQASRIASEVPNDLSFLVRLRRRIALPQTDRGPRALTLAGDKAYIANYFSDTFSIIDLTSGVAESGSLPKARLAGSVTSLARKGEFYFNDASICFQGWQSCASCHSSDGRVDGLNWDNLNDGIGNPKNVKSLLFAHETPPSMWLGVRANAAVAVRAGVKNSLFTVQPPEVADALDAYLASLRNIPSPRLQKGNLSGMAQRGENLFTGAAGCAECHPKPRYTDLKKHNVGTASGNDQPQDRFDTPSLTEVWRTAPYLHNGSATTIRDVLTVANPQKQHGNVASLSDQELSDLVEFVLSL